MKEFTIKEVANIAGVSKNAIRFRIRKIKNFTNKYMRISSKGNTRLISNEGAKKLLGKSIDNTSNNYSSQLLVKHLINDNNDLKDQRDKANVEISRLTNLLDHEQELNLTTQSQLKRLQSSSKSNMKHGFIWRLFH